MMANAPSGAGWVKFTGPKRITAELRAIQKSPTLSTQFFDFTLIDDDLYRWRFKVKNFDNDIQAGNQLNRDLYELGQACGQDYILMEILFPQDYPTNPFFVRVVSPRCVMYTGHVTAGGSICIEALVATGGPGGWRPDYGVEGILVLVVANMLHAEVSHVRTPTGPGGISGPLRLDMSRGLSEYSLREAQAAYSRTVANHGWSNRSTGSAAKGSGAASFSASSALTFAQLPVVPVAQPSAPFGFVPSTATAPAGLSAFAQPTTAPVAGTSAPVANANSTVLASVETWTGVEPSAAPKVASSAPLAGIQLKVPKPAVVSVVEHSEATGAPELNSTSTGDQTVAVPTAETAGVSTGEQSVASPVAGASAPLFNAELKVVGQDGVSSGEQPEASPAAALSTSRDFANSSISGPKAAPEPQAIGVIRDSQESSAGRAEPSDSTVVSRSVAHRRLTVRRSANGPADRRTSGGTNGNDESGNAVSVRPAEGDDVSGQGATTAVVAVSEPQNASQRPEAGDGDLRAQLSALVISNSRRAKRMCVVSDDGQLGVNESVTVANAQHATDAAVEAGKAQQAAAAALADLMAQLELTKAKLEEEQRAKQLLEERVKDIISRTLMPCVPGHSNLSSGLSSVPSGPIQSEDADDVLTSAPPPAHWDPMRKGERIGVKMLVLPLPGDPMSGSSTVAVPGATSASLGTGVPILPADINVLVSKGLNREDATDLLWRCNGNLNMVYTLAAEAVQHGGILAFLERERQAAKATNYLLNPAVKAAWEVELECVLSRFERGNCLPRSRIVRVERIQNWRLWTKYFIRRREIEARMRAQSAISTEGLVMGRGVNEFLLWHGTSNSVVESVVKDGFDVRESRATGLLGEGIYFAANAKCSLSYTDYRQRSLGVPASSAFPGRGGALLLCRVTLGAMAMGERELRKPPAGADSVYMMNTLSLNMSAQPGTGMNAPLAAAAAMDPAWDVCSFLGENLIGAVYDNCQAYPEYVLHLD